MLRWWRTRKMLRYAPAMLKALEAVYSIHWIGASRQGRVTLETAQWREGDQMLRDVAAVLKAIHD